MFAISVVIIAKNEAHNLPRLLRSVQWADEILVADTGSDDATKEISREMGAKVIELSWEGFGITKQKAVDAAKYDWIFSLDADEEVSQQLTDKILSLKKDLSPGYAYKIKRVSMYLNKKIRYCGWQKDYPLRLFYRKEAKFNTKQVHEGVKTNAEIKFLKEQINHYTYPKISDHWKKINFYTTLNVLEKYNAKRNYSVSEAVFQGIWKFMQMYFLKMGFRDGKMGFILCLNSAIGQYLKYIKLWEKQRNASAH